MYECDMCDSQTSPDNVVLSPNDDIICEKCNEAEARKVIEEYHG